MCAVCELCRSHHQREHLTDANDRDGTVYCLAACTCELDNVCAVCEPPAASRLGTHCGEEGVCVDTGGAYFDMIKLILYWACNTKCILHRMEIIAEAQDKRRVDV